MKEGLDILSLSNCSILKLNLLQCNNLKGIYIPCDIGVWNQSITLTRNPNIPVSPDADRILFCVYSNDKTSEPDGIKDRSIIQKSSVDIMQGGKEAFEKRNLIYDSWMN